MESESSHICRVDTRLYCRRKGKSSAAVVHSSNLVVLESAGGGDIAEDGELEMGNKSSGGFSPADGKKQSGRWFAYLPPGMYYGALGTHSPVTRSCLTLHVMSNGEVIPYMAIYTRL